MQTIESQSRITLSPDVAKLVFDPAPEGELARLWTRYLKGLIGEDGFDLEDVVAPEVRCIDLDLAGFPPGMAGLRRFCERMRLFAPDQRIHVLHLLVRMDQATVEGLIRCSRGDDLPTGGQMGWEARTLARFSQGRMIERWDRSEMTALVAQRPVAT